MKKQSIVSLLLVIALVLSLALAGCGSNSSVSSDPSTDTNNADTVEETPDSTDETGDAETGDDAGEESVDLSYEDLSEEIYMDNLGEFYEYYMTAKEEVENTSLRYALMAIAEAKLMESATTIPTNTYGGRYGMTRMTNRTISTIKWGTDYRRYHSAIVTEEIFKSEDVSVLRDMWNELRGTGTYLEQAREYVTEQGYTIKDAFNISYTADPLTWDALATSLASDSDVLVNTYDGLLEYDCENELQPALAESYEKSDDGLTYTFHIRPGVKWVDSQGREIGEVTADDWVAAMQHVLDAQEGLEYLVEGVILNASEYIYGEITDFSQVGVEAVDDYTLVYTLAAPTTYFDTMLTYNIFAPLCRSYYQSLGGSFGADYAIDGSGSYGLDPDSIAYCGPYLISNWTSGNMIVFTYNESYWNPDNVNVHTITWLYDDGSDPTKAYNDFQAGTIDTLSLTSSTLELAKEDGSFDQYSYVGLTQATTFVIYTNLNRAAFANFNDATAAVSPKADNEEEQARTQAAMNNVHFRRALATSIDQLSWNAQEVGDDLAATSLRNSYTPGDFLSLEEDVTVDINGTATTFPAGTYYGAIMQAQLDADGFPVVVWDSEAEGGAGYGDGYDGWYNPEYAVSELALAVEELAAEGVTVDADHPIQLDLIYPASEVTYTNKAMALKQSVENVTGSAIVINAVAANNDDEWYYALYYPGYGYECNFDLNDFSGWGPDYGDPSTYLDTMLPYYAGYMVKMLGIY